MMRRHLLQQKHLRAQCDPRTLIFDAEAAEDAAMNPRRGQLGCALAIGSSTQLGNND
jgi:hypothetical protein